MDDTKSYNMNQMVDQPTRTRPKSAAAITSNISSRVGHPEDADEELRASSPAVAHNLTRPYTAHPRYL